MVYGVYIDMKRINAKIEKMGLKAMVKLAEKDEFGNGYWVYLRDGALTENGYGCQTIHEMTVAETLSALDGVVIAWNSIEE